MTDHIDPALTAGKRAVWKVCPRGRPCSSTQVTSRRRNPCFVMKYNIRSCPIRWLSPSSEYSHFKFRDLENVGQGHNVKHSQGLCFTAFVWWRHANVNAIGHRNAYCWISGHPVYGFVHFQSNGASLLLLIDLYLHFQGQTFEILLFLLLSRKWWEIEQTLLVLFDRKSGICHWMAPLWMLFIVTLTYKVEVTKSGNMCNFWWEQRKMLKYHFYRCRY